MNLLILFRPCGSTDVDEERKPVTTYTIEGADMYKDHSLFGRQYHINGKNLNDTSFMTLPDDSFNKEPLPYQYTLPMDGDPNRSLPSTHDNGPPFSISMYRKGLTIPDFKGNSPYNSQTMSYDRFPPPLLSTEINPSGATAARRSNTFGGNNDQPKNPLYIKSLTRPSSPSSLNIQMKNKRLESPTRPTTRPWTKHPRWVVRLSQPKQVHTPPLTNNREPSSKNLTSSIRSTSTIPRYAFANE